MTLIQVSDFLLNVTNKKYINRKKTKKNHKFKQKLTNYIIYVFVYSRIEDSRFREPKCCSIPTKGVTINYLTK